MEGSGVVALLRSGRLGRHTVALGAMGVEGTEDGHVEELVSGLPCLQVKIVVTQWGIWSAHGFTVDGECSPVVPCDGFPKCGKYSTVFDTGYV